MFSLGIDSGSTTTKGILLDDQGIKKQLLIRTSASPRKSLYEIYHTFHSDLVTVTVTTGYGRSLLKEANPEDHGNNLPCKRQSLFCPNLRRRD